MTGMHQDLVALFNEAKTKETKRLTLQREADQLKNEEDNLKALLLTKLRDAGLNHFTCEYGTAVVQEKQKPFIVDYTMLETYIIENRAIDLLQKRLTESAVKARWEDGKSIPGVGLIKEYKVQLR